MKSALAGFATMVLLLLLHVAPPPQALMGHATATDRGFAERHANESEAALRDELGLGAR